MDPFFYIDLLINEDNETFAETLTSQNGIDFFAVRFINNESDEEDEWEFEGIPLNNIFHIINEDMV